MRIPKLIFVIPVLLFAVSLHGCKPQDHPKPLIPESKPVIQVVEEKKPSLVIPPPKVMDLTATPQRSLLTAAEVDQAPQSLFLPKFFTRPGEQPVERAGVRFDQTATVNGKTLHLRGSGVRKYDISSVSLITIYTVGFYAPADVAITDEIPDVEKILILEYHLDVPKEKVVRAIHESVESNPRVDVTKVKTSFEQLSDAFDSPKKGSRYIFAYIPGKGTAMMKNGKVLTVIPTREFEKAFFDIWLSPDGSDLQMRCELLALPCPQKLFQKPLDAVSAGLGNAREKLGRLKKLIP